MFPFFKFMSSLFNLKTWKKHTYAKAAFYNCQKNSNVEFKFDFILFA